MDDDDDDDRPSKPYTTLTLTDVEPANQIFLLDTLFFMLPLKSLSCSWTSRWLWMSKTLASGIAGALHAEGAQVPYAGARSMHEWLEPACQTTEAGILHGGSAYYSLLWPQISVMAVVSKSTSLSQHNRLVQRWCTMTSGAALLLHSTIVHKALAPPQQPTQLVAGPLLTQWNRSGKKCYFNVITITWYYFILV